MRKNLKPIAIVAAMLALGIVYVALFYESPDDVPAPKQGKEVDADVTILMAPGTFAVGENYPELCYASGDFEWMRRDADISFASNGTVVEDGYLSLGGTVNDAGECDVRMPAIIRDSGTQVITISKNDHRVVVECELSQVPISDTPAGRYAFMLIEVTPGGVSCGQGYPRGIDGRPLTVSPPPETRIS